METTKKIDFWVLGTVILLLVGLLIGVYLVSQPQIFRSRASDVKPPSLNEPWQGLEVKDARGNWVRCEKGPIRPVCEVTSLDFQVRYRP